MSNMSGNPFLNYTLQAIVELPANVLAPWLCDRFGRRWVHTGFFLLEVPIYIALAIFAKGEDKNLISMLNIYFYN